jgi:hypothetical protein
MSEYHDGETGEVVETPRVSDTRVQRGALLSSPETAEVWGALVEAQGKIEPPQRTKTAKVKGRTKAGVDYEYEYKYAPLDEVLNKARGPLQEAGLGFQQYLASRGRQSVVRTVIFHKSGQWTAVDYPIFYDASKGAQGFASGVTYARRYGLTLALGIAPEDDDDANVADSQPATISERSKGVTRAAAPRPITTAIHPATSGAAGSSTGNGAQLEWIPKFLARKSYEIDAQKAGGWSAFERLYCAIADAADDLDQLMKLDDDNKQQCVEFSRAVRPAVYDRFREHVKANAVRLAPEQFIDVADTELPLAGR